MRIDVTENFARLSKTPIVEAVVEVRTRVGSVWNPESARSLREEEFPDFPISKARHAFAGTMEFVAGGDSNADIESSWSGLELRDGDDTEVLFLERDRFLYSRRQPYDGWETFRARFMDFWTRFSRRANPGEIQRLGLRFINRLEMDGVHPLDFYLRYAPEHPESLTELKPRQLLVRELFDVPGTSYEMTIARAVENSQSPVPASSLIIDIDVGMSDSINFVSSGAIKCLDEMRWLKNKAFFGTLTEGALEMFR